MERYVQNYYDHTLNRTIALRPILKQEDHYLSAVYDCLFNIFRATLHYLEAVSPIRILRTRHAVVKGTHITGWKGNKDHPFNSRRGRLKGPKNVLTIWGLNFIVLSEKGVSCSVLFKSYCLYYRQRLCEKMYISKFILQGRNVIFKKYFTCSMQFT